MNSKAGDFVPTDTKPKPAEAPETAVQEAKKTAPAASATYQAPYSDKNIYYPPTSFPMGGIIPPYQAPYQQVPF